MKKILREKSKITLEFVVNVDKKKKHTHTPKLLISQWNHRSAAQCTSRIISRTDSCYPWRRSGWRLLRSCRRSWTPHPHDQPALGSTVRIPWATGEPCCPLKLWAACSHWDWSTPWTPHPSVLPLGRASPTPRILLASRPWPCSRCCRWPKVGRLHRNWHRAPHHCAWQPDKVPGQAFECPRSARCCPGSQ